MAFQDVNGGILVIENMFLFIIFLCHKNVQPAGIPGSGSWFELVKRYFRKKCRAWRCRGGQCIRENRQQRGKQTLVIPPLCDQGAQSRTSSVGRGVMNGGLCPGRDHHIPPEPLCGVQQSGGGWMPGPDTRKPFPLLSYSHEKRQYYFYIVEPIDMGIWKIWW